MLNTHVRSSVFVNYSEGQLLDISLHIDIVESAAHETFDVERARRHFLDQSLDDSSAERTYVFRGFMETWFIALSPIKRPWSLKATDVAVCRFPSSFVMISTPFLFQTPTRLPSPFRRHSKIQRV
jgi:hypothetical protein